MMRWQKFMGGGHGVTKTEFRHKMDLVYNCIARPQDLLLGKLIYIISMSTN